MTEKEYLISLALLYFNQQIGTSIQVRDCDVRSIPTSSDYDRSYEIWTIRTDDHLRLRIHMRFAHEDSLGRFRLESDGSTYIGTLGDEVYITTGTIDRYYVQEGIYRFNTLTDDVAKMGVLLIEEGYALATEQGEFLLLG